MEKKEREIKLPTWVVADIEIEEELHVFGLVCRENDRVEDG